MNEITYINQTKFEKILTSIVPQVFQGLSTERLNLERIQSRSYVASKTLFTSLSTDLERTIKSFEHSTLLGIKESLSNLKLLSEALLRSTNHFNNTFNTQLQRIDSAATLLSPENTLKRGYSITTIDGKILKSSEKVGKGAKIRTRLFDGEIDSIVT